MKIILDLCGGTGAWAIPYKENGYTVITVTLPAYDITKTDIYDCDDGKRRISFRNSNGDIINLDTGTEILDILVEDVYGIICAPPCDHFSIARNDKTAKIPRDLRKGMETVDACFYIIRECLYNNYRKMDKNGLKFWALENPTTGYLERMIGKAPFNFEPCDFGDPYTKKTSLWGEFNFPVKNPVKAEKVNFVKYAATDDPIKQEKLKLIPEGYQKKTGYDTRKVMRSITPQGFARAFYEANK